MAKKPPMSNWFYPELTSPPKVVLTPLAALTAVLPNEADTGIDWKNDPKRLAAPNATIS
jgi:hypothetical protein